MEGSQYRTNDNRPQIESTDMVWPHVKEGSGGYHQEDAKYELKEKKGRPKKRSLDNIRGHEKIQYDRRHGRKSKCEDKGQPITTWRRYVGEKKN